jgi:hypothetical protein
LVGEREPTDDDRRRRSWMLCTDVGDPVCQPEYVRSK